MNYQGSYPWYPYSIQTNHYTICTAQAGCANIVSLVISLS
jgi:hypothetical protein